MSGTTGFSIVHLAEPDGELLDIIDGVTRAILVIDYVHHEIHSGSHFFIDDYTTLDTDETIEFVVTTPNTIKWLHMLFSVSTSDVAQIDVYEGSSSVSGGTPVTARNNNRNSSNVSGATILANPDSITDGTKIAGYSFGSTGGGNAASVGGEASSREAELILKQNTTYLWRVTSLADNNIISYAGRWYEHTSR